MNLPSSTETTTIQYVLALTQDMPAAERWRLAELLVRAEDKPLPEHASLDEAIELYLADACSLGRAAELAGLTRWDVMARLKERGIPMPMPHGRSAREIDELIKELEHEGIM